MGRKGKENMVLNFSGTPNIFGREPFNLSEANIIRTAGAPTGSFKEGTVLINVADNRMYVRTPISVLTPQVLWLKLEDNGTDSSTDGTNTATASGGAYGAGKYDRGYVFDGDDAILTVGDSTDFDLDGDFTIEMWVNLDLTAAFRYLFNRTEDGSNYYYAHINSSGTLFFLVREGATTNSITSPAATITADTWHYIAIVGDREGGIMKIYVDGEEIVWNVLTAATSFTGADDDLIFGEDSTNGNPVDGTMDEIKIWTSARTQSEIKFDMLDSTQENLTWVYIPLQKT